MRGSPEGQPGPDWQNLVIPAASQVPEGIQKTRPRSYNLRGHIFFCFPSHREESHLSHPIQLHLAGATKQGTS